MLVPLPGDTSSTWHNGTQFHSGGYHFLSLVPVPGQTPEETEHEKAAGRSWDKLTCVAAVQWSFGMFRSQHTARVTVNVSTVLSVESGLPSLMGVILGSL